MNLTEHFTLEELTASDTAARLGIDNTPGPVERANLVVLANKLEVVRLILGAPLIISSGYRCLALNRKLRSDDTSAHVQGLGADFTCPGFGTPLEIALRLASRRDEIGFDQLIHEFGRWVHVGFRLKDPRGELLTVDTRGTRAGLLA